MPVRASHDALIFLHVPKTAGSTLYQVFGRQFRRSQIFVPRGGGGLGKTAYLRHVVVGDMEPIVQHGLDRNRREVERLRALSPESATRIRVLLGHFWFGIHEALPGTATYVTMLRDPVDRVLSLYQHRRTRHGLRSTIEEYLAEDRDVQMRNGQVRRFVGSASELFHVDVTDEMLATALGNLDRHFPVVGLTERFDESLVLMARRFGWPVRRLRYFPVNVGSGRPRRESLSAEALALIEERNRHDLELYRHAAERFERQVAAEDPESFARDLAELRRWNRWYRRFGPPIAALGRKVRTATRPARRVAGRAIRGGRSRAGAGERSAR
ncbi:MAG: sulfotransferase family 2 domain-containing protein [Actinobacteria bacterium]|nr:sulfotransferase family 2 domain-containing protein [Actinomycetota bacterium]